jgi:D-alanyl-D-alanine dipeptidase
MASSLASLLASLAGAAALACALPIGLQGAQAQNRLPPGFVYLRDVDKSIAQDMRYAGANNFTGRPLPGYGAAECALRRDAALALKQVRSELKANGLSLKVYDCYRPQRAVDAMARWASSREDNATRRFYPQLKKRRLFADGWIALRSKHSAGIAIDLTLVPVGSTTPAFDPHARYGDCDGAQRAPDNSVDMGTGFDCFSARSYTRNSAIDTQAKANRARLVAAMKRHGFGNYFREWWHFAYRRGAAAVTYDVPIARR